RYGPVRGVARRSTSGVGYFLGRSGLAGTPTTVAPGGTSWPLGTTALAATVAPSPTETGATRTAPEPIMASAPMTVRPLECPSELAVTAGGPRGGLGGGGGGPGE